MSKKIKIKKIADIVAYVVVGLLVVLVALVLLAKINGEPAFIFNYAVLWVKTGSMEPQIPSRSYILIEKANAADVVKAVENAAKEKKGGSSANGTGVIITFHSDDPSIYGEINTHEVIEVVNNGTEFRTKGTNSGPDKKTAKANKIVGIYKGNLPLVFSLFGRFLSTPLGILVMFILVFAIILAVYLPDIIKQFSEKNKKKQFDELVQAEVERLKLENADTDDEDK